MIDSVSFNGFDFFLLVVIGFSSLFGLLRGFMREVVSLATWIAAFVLAIMFTQEVSVYFQQYVKTPYLAHVISFLVIFIGTLLLGGAVNYILRFVMPGVGFVVSNHILGAIFGVLRGLIIALFIIVVISMSSFRGVTWLQHSVFAKEFQQPVAWLMQRIKINLPNITLPKVTIPNIKIPDIKLPDINLSNLNSSSLSIS